MDAQAKAGGDDLQLSAWNGAFWDLGFRWQWDAGTFRSLDALPDDRQKLATYIERYQPHLLRAYDRDFLIEAIHAGKERRRAAMLAARSRGERAQLSCNALRASS